MDLFELGLTIIPDFITKEEESYILSKLTKKSPTKNKERNSIQRYGSKIPYKSGVVSDIIPDFLQKILDKIIESKLLDEKPDSVTINEYYKGQYIAPHIDSINSGEVITVLGLLSPATMIFSKNSQSISIEFPERALVQMRDQIRYNWKHSIEAVKDVRYSLVFRRGVVQI